jgi:hypothetical protein
MRKIQQILFTIVFCGAPCLVFTPVADACGVPSISQTFTKAQLRTDPRNPLDSVSAASVTRDLNFASAFRPASIVGMWDTQFISEGNTTLTPPIPDGAVIDFGYVQWHGEGTELFNSGSRAPATQNFCMGAHGTLYVRFEPLRVHLRYEREPYRHGQHPGIGDPVVWGDALQRYLYDYAVRYDGHTDRSAYGSDQRNSDYRRHPAADRNTVTPREQTPDRRKRRTGAGSPPSCCLAPLFPVLRHNA